MPQAVALGPEGNPQFTCFEMTAKPSQDQHYSDSKLKKVEADGRKTIHKADDFCLGLNGYHQSHTPFIFGMLLKLLNKFF